MSQVTPSNEAGVDAGNADPVLHQLLVQHGPLMDMRALAKVLCYPSRSALDQSVRRGHVGIALRRIPHRRGAYALTADVYQYLRGLEPEQGLPITREAEVPRSA